MIDEHFWERMLTIVRPLYLSETVTSTDIHYQRSYCKGVKTLVTVMHD